MQQLQCYLLPIENQSCFYQQNRTNSLPRRENGGGGGGQSYGPLPNSGGHNQNPRARDFSLTRMSSLGNNQPGPQWTDSLPRRDFYSNIAPTGSLPRRDKAGLGRPEPPRPQSSLSNDNNGFKPGQGGGGNLRRRDLSLNRDNTSSFRSDAFSGNKGKNTRLEKGIQNM